MEESKKIIKEVSIVIPCFNESEVIHDTINSTKLVLDRMNLDSYEIIVVDDGSDDKTGETAKKCGAKVIFNPNNVGYGRSLKNGINAANFDTIVIFDGDGTYPIDKIPNLMEEYQKNFDMVVGERKGIYYWESRSKKILRIILKLLVEFSTGTKIADINSGFRVFSKNTIAKYFNNLSDVFSFTTTATLSYILTKRHISYVPIEYQKRVGKTKVRFIRDSLRTLQSILQTILIYNPIKIFIVFSLFTLILSFLYISFGVGFGHYASIWIGLVGIFAAIIILCTGFLAYLISRK